MAGPSDNRRRVCARVARGSADRFSALPDAVLRGVLSQLTSREAVHTSLLASRWRDLWRSVPIINVSFEEFEDRSAEDEIEREETFKDFVNDLLEHRNHDGLDEFRLLYISSTGNSSADANQWISHALQLNAQAVKVVGCGEPISLDSAVFSSDHLKRLHISGATMGPGFFHQLKTSCPALEYLFLYDCYIPDLVNYSRTLKVLILSEHVSFRNHSGICAPNLISLSIEGDFRETMLPALENMRSLQTASVLLRGYIPFTDAHAISQLLASLSGVTSLDFCYGANRVTMENNFQWCPKFTNLINLTLDAWCVHAEFYGLIVFLQQSPSLKKLTLKLDQGNVSSITGELEDRSFTCEQLEVVRIICSETSELLPRVVQFLSASGIRPDQMQMPTRHQN